MSISPEICSIQGTNYRMTVSGQGETVVFLHGGHTNLDVWEEQISFFARYFRVIAFDQRGYGHTDIPSEPFSYEDDLKHILDEYMIERAILIGASFGGSVAIDFALTYPDRVKALVLAGPAVNGNKLPLRMRLESIKSYVAVKSKGIHTAADQFERNRYWKYFIPKQADRRKRFMDIFRTNEAFYTWDLKLNKSLSPPAAARISEIRMPTLIIEPGDDLKFNIKTCQRLQKGISQSELVRLPHCGHLPNLERPDEFNEAVYAWLLKL
ncbi:alpha/beta hydrolase [Paenibacillus sp. N3/727]|uniref:alpha/beta fold hydrolase n=1 Tax=Paenibacillus sp. N3/727 TaxID=2925845 RepID=UPI001F536586|nr:alpha/beta hydrolase [Paenibacillus sp. N3/727]UNK16552.1 alpha/beta hydrolase [Paenibacillus sp. N3/727]